MERKLKLIREISKSGRGKAKRSELQLLDENVKGEEDGSKGIEAWLNRIGYGAASSNLLPLK